MVINIDKVMTQVTTKALTKLATEAVTKGVEKTVTNIVSKVAKKGDGDDPSLNFKSNCKSNDGPLRLNDSHTLAVHCALCAVCG